MRRALGLLFVAVLALDACASDPAPQGYSFPGCEDAGAVGSGCASGSPVFDCVQEHLQAKHDTCTEDSECVLVSVSSTCMFMGCGFPVRADEAGNFRDELLNESERFCAVQSGSTTSGEGCAFGGVGCSSAPVAYCDAGHCAVESSPDAGFLGD
jgi:hypothetical protein